MEQLTQPNIELDARLVLVAMNEGMDGVMSYAFSRLDIFPTTQCAVDRCFWLKSQPKDYINSVSIRIEELERTGK